MSIDSGSIDGLINPSIFCWASGGYTGMDSDDVSIISTAFPKVQTKRWAKRYTHTQHKKKVKKKTHMCKPAWLGNPGNRKKSDERSLGNGSPLSIVLQKGPCTRGSQRRIVLILFSVCRPNGRCLGWYTHIDYTVLSTTIKEQSKVLML